MNEPSDNIPRPLRRERLLIRLLCAVAIVRVLVFSAAFPFFNPIDEISHFDLTVKYSEGHLPRGVERYSEEAQPFMYFFGSLEYFAAANELPGGRYPAPPWTLSPQAAAAQVQANAVSNLKTMNYESGQPPLYYLMTGAVWRFGRLLRFTDSLSLYSLRFINAVFLGAVVWLAYLAGRTFFPDRALVRLGAPALAAFMPQCAFYTVQNDIPSPIFFGIAFICLAHWLRGDTLTVKMGCVLGLSLAATFLTKLTNLPLLAVALLVVMVQLWRLSRANALRPALAAVAGLMICGGLPAVALLLWNKHAHGDFVASAGKIHALGWTLKPVGEWWHHRLFTLRGLWAFLSGLIASFWQGENYWHGDGLISPAARIVYPAVTLIVLGIALAGLLLRRGNAAAGSRPALWLGFACLAAGVLFLAFLSIIYDFHNCFYPSRAFPFFASGRLLLGALVPFLLVFVSGLDWAFGWLKAKWAGPVALVAVILFLMVTEIATNLPVFSSQYNWFHM